MSKPDKGYEFDPKTGALIVDGVEYETTAWGPGYRTDTYGNNRACDCKELRKVKKFCVCYGICWCPNHPERGLRCVGGHD